MQDSFEQRLAEQVELEKQETARKTAALSILKNAKKHVETVVEQLKKLEKLNGKTAKSKKAIKTMEKFLKCNITNPAIYTRYQEVMILMEQYANIAREEENAKS